MRGWPAATILYVGRHLNGMIRYEGGKDKKGDHQLIGIPVKPRAA